MIDLSVISLGRQVICFSLVNIFIAGILTETKIIVNVIKKQTNLLQLLKFSLSW